MHRPSMRSTPPRAGAWRWTFPPGSMRTPGRSSATRSARTLTISFIGLKRGLFTGRGPACAGEVRFDGLDVPPAIYASEVLSARRIDWRKERELLPPRPATCTRAWPGHVLMVGGAPGTSGAARHRRRGGASRSGAGLVTVATHPEHAALLNLTRPELMVSGRARCRRADGGRGAPTDRRHRPGTGAGRLGSSSCSRPRWRLGRPMVLDADALNLLAAAPRRATTGC
jgi:hypothetical protein